MIPYNAPPTSRPGADGGPRFPLARLAGKVSRRLARVLPTKPFAMRNAAPLVSFTFDDIPETAATTGAALLERHGARGTFYVSGELCGTATDVRFASVEQCLALHRAGHEIGCHTLTHANAEIVDETAMAAEMAGNQRFFGRLSADIVLDNFAYCYGAVSLPRKWQLQRRYASCRGTKAGLNVGWVDLGLLRAVELYDRVIDRPAIDALIAENARRKGWLIFVTHDVAETPSVWGCTPDQLEYAIGAARRENCAVLTVREALRRAGHERPQAAR